LVNKSSYLDRPLLPFAVALPRMLEQIEVELATAGPAEARCLGQQPELLTPRWRSPYPAVT
jgi:hypothetical protein